ncbi:MAG: hypothetical protein ACREBH_00750 [Candidatus Micrarchaeaceae archaeon]
MRQATIEKQAKGSVSSTKNKFTSATAMLAVKCIATVATAVLDKNYIESIRGTTVFVSLNNAPREAGYYLVGRENWDGQNWQEIGLDLDKEDDAKKWENAGWRERLRVYEGSIEAAKEGRALALYVNYDDYYGRLWLGLDASDDVARVAKLERKPEQHVADMLRVGLL